MTTPAEFTSAEATALRKQVRILAALAGVTASCAVMVPQFMPQRVGFGAATDALGVFLAFSFLTFVIGVATPIYAYARSVKIGVRMPAAAFSPLALLLAAIVAMIAIGAIRRETRDVRFTPKARPPVETTQPRE